MSVVFDATTGHLQLDPEAFVGLVDYAGDPGSVGDEVLARLRSAGAVVGGAPHPRLQGALAAVANSLGSLQVLRSDTVEVSLHQSWVAFVSAMLTDLGDGTYAFAAVGTDFLPAEVARFTGLSPRPLLADAEAVVDESLLDALSAGAAPTRAAGSATLADALAPWPAAAAAVRAGRWSLAVVDVAFPAPTGTVVRRLAWVDTEAGLLRVEVDDRGPVLVPTTSTALWEAVVALLPTDAETGLLPRTA
ncbi:hypothetical protein [Terrabacter sp. NPDC080008]|uniref:hypothetical protein n=1 Tax=Terrabacter sp. NPDC080008 TaxID=3155176 RepID=UPI00344BA6ED